jgi:hypothetical protein
MKICVIGNSHVAAIKLAYEAARPKILPEMTFFAGLGTRIATLQIADGMLVPPADDHKIQFAIKTTSGGLSQIDPALYDRFLVIGMSGGVHQMVETISRGISEGAKLCAVKDYWQAAPLAPLLQTLRKITDKPITVGAAPLLAEEQQNNTGPDRYSQFLTLSNSLFFKDFEAELMGQPLDTIVNGNATEIGYSRMSERLIAKKDSFGIHHPEGENSHMNQSYGTLWLAQYFESTQR